MAENITRDSAAHLKSETLLKSMLPINVSFETTHNLMPTAFSLSPYWRSLVIVGQNQVQRNGLLLQAALTHASLDKQVMFVMKKEFTRFPPTTHGMTPLGPESMANIVFKYCQDVKSLEELLTSFSNLSAEQLPDVIIVNGLNEYQESVNAFFFSKTFSMLLEATDYVGQKKQSTALLYASLALTNTIVEHKNIIPIFQQWVHEVWVLEGTSNRLVSGNIQVQFTVLGPNIYLKTVSRTHSA